MEITTNISSHNSPNGTETEYLMDSNSNNHQIITSNNIQKLLSERPSPLCLTIVIVFFVVGAIGNFLALIILAKKKTSKNSKYTLMLRCLASNNLIALMGMLTQLILKIFLPMHIQKSYVRWSCAGLVVWRFFGLSSGCIAAVMAAERWMALARPFTYHKHITYKIVKRTIQYLIGMAAIITFLPFFGFGVYFDEEKKICLRYRHATELTDISYAYLFMTFGTLLCTIIVGCNFFVTRVLYLIGRNKSSKRSNNYDMVNRDNRTGGGGGGGGGGSTLLHHQNSNSPPTASPDEIRFAKLMTFLSISFVICWMPQMISIPLALMPNPLPAKHWFFRIADILMALHFTSDPYVYVLSRTKYSFFLNCVKRWRNGIQRSQSLQSRLRPTEQTIDYGLNT